MVPLKAAGFASLLTYLTIICKSPFIQNWIYIITINVQLTTQLKWNQRSALRPSPHFIPSLGRKTLAARAMSIFRPSTWSFFSKRNPVSDINGFSFDFFQKMLQLIDETICAILNMYFETQIFLLFFSHLEASRRNLATGPESGYQKRHNGAPLPSQKPPNLTSQHSQVSNENQHGDCWNIPPNVP